MERYGNKAVNTVETSRGKEFFTQQPTELFRQTQIVSIFDLVHQRLGYIAMPEIEKGCRSLTGNPPGKTLFNIVVLHCCETRPRHERHAGGVKVAFVANKNGTTMAANSWEYDVKKITKRAENVSRHSVQGRKRQLSP
jgi:hypothetical protein